jgi:hypothetical protein
MTEDPYYAGPWGDSGTGLDVAVGNFGQGFPVAWLLLIFPAVLAILAFLNQSFKVLCGASIVCLIGKIIFVSVAPNFGDKLTANNWIILVLYLGLCGFTIYCLIKKGKI